MSIGLGVSISNLFGTKTAEVLQKAIGKRIAVVELGEDDALYFLMEDGYQFCVFDDGQSCCEDRYMRTDDDLSSHTGETLLGFEIKEAPPVKYDEYGEHEIQFLEVITNSGVFTMASHNEHNGYYGGFIISAKECGELS